MKIINARDSLIRSASCLASEGSDAPMKRAFTELANRVHPSIQIDEERMAEVVNRVMNPDLPWNVDVLATWTAYIVAVAIKG